MSVLSVQNGIQTPERGVQHESGEGLSLGGYRSLVRRMVSTHPFDSDEKPKIIFSFPAEDTLVMLATLTTLS